MFNIDQQPSFLCEVIAVELLHLVHLLNAHSRSLRMMEGYGLVKLKRDRLGVEPVALAIEFLIVLNEPKTEKA